MTFIVIVAIVVIVLIVWKVKSPDVVYETENVSRGTVIEKISVTGSIAAKTKINLQAEASAKVIKIEVTEGDEVEAGDLLVSLNASDLSARIAGQQASVEAATALLNQYKAGATLEELQVSVAAVAAAKARHNASITAKADAEKALVNAQTSRETTNAKVVVNLESKVDSLIQAYDSGLTAAQDAINRLTSAMFTGDILTFVASDAQASNNAMSTRVSARAAVFEMESKILMVKATGTADAAVSAYLTFSVSLQTVKTHIDACATVLNYADSLAPATRTSYQLNVSTAQSAMNANIQAVTTAKNTLDLQEQLNDAEVTAADTAVTTAATALNNATHAMDTAEKAVAQAEADYDYRKAGVRPEQIAAQEARVKAEKAGLSSLYADYAKRLIKAPIDGIVTEVNVEVGESVQMGKVIAIMNTKGKFEIVANISEVDIARLKVGNSVEVTLDAFPLEEVWSGKVISVWPAEKVVEGVIFYETKIVFSEEDDRLKSGMTANLEIESGRKDDVLRIPIMSLREKAGRRYVKVMQDNEIIEKDIRIGLENSEYLELLEGLNEGETVVTSESKK